MSACRFVATDQPRVIPGRHGYECPGGEECPGCLPCPGPHCRVCGVAHDEGACPECLAEVRENLGEIRRRAGDLLVEAEHRGVNGDAMVLLGPSADPEARGHLEASVAAGRVPRDRIEVSHAKDCPDQATCLGCAEENAPGWVIPTWAMVYREAFDHDEPSGKVDMLADLSYLERNLTYMATWPHVPFEDFARSVRLCVGRLEAVLHDQERGVRANVPCFDCGQDLERKLGAKGFDDHWTCRGCKRRYTIAEYNFALRAALEESA